MAFSDVANQDSPAKRLPHFPELDGIRGIAAILVFCHHIFYTTISSVGLNGWSATVQGLHKISAFGVIGVDLFFVLSGFLITSMLIQEKRGARYYQDFYWKRALRILPLYSVCLSGLWIFTRQSHYVFLSALFLANFSGLFHVSAFGPFWTLSIEEQFYLIWPNIVRRSAIPTLFRWSIVMGLGACGLRVVAAIYGKHNYDYTFLRCDGLAFGAALACQFRRKSWEGGRKRSHDICMVSLGGVGLLLILRSSSFDFFHPALSFAAFQTGQTALCGAIVGLTVAHTGSRALSVLRSRGLLFFGVISYAFYMLHLFVINAYDHFAGMPMANHVTGYWLRSVACLGTTILLSVVSRYWIELPAIRLRYLVLSHPISAGPADAPLPLGRMD